LNFQIQAAKIFFLPYLANIGFCAWQAFFDDPIL
jgi:hypothetical protein